MSSITASTNVVSELPASRSAGADLRNGLLWTCERNSTEEHHDPCEPMHGADISSRLLDLKEQRQLGDGLCRRRRVLEPARDARQDVTELLVRGVGRDREHLAEFIDLDTQLDFVASSSGSALSARRQQPTNAARPVSIVRSTTSSGNASMRAGAGEVGKVSRFGVGSCFAIGALVFSVSRSKRTYLNEGAIATESVTRMATGAHAGITSSINNSFE